MESINIRRDRVRCYNLRTECIRFEGKSQRGKRREQKTKKKWRKRKSQREKWDDSYPPSSAGIRTKKAEELDKRRIVHNQHSPRQWFESEPIQTLCLMAQRRSEKVAPNGRNSPLSAGSAYRVQTWINPLHNYNIGLDIYRIAFIGTTFEPLQNEGKEYRSI